MPNCKKLQKKKTKLTKEELKQWDICVKARQEERERKKETRDWVSKQLH